MDERQCSRPDCDNPLNTGKYYCSTACSALDRERKRKLKKAGKAVSMQISPRLMDTFIPQHVQTLIAGHVGDGAYEVLNEMANVMLEEATPAPPLSGKTEGDFTWSYYVGGKDRRPTDALDHDIIAEMMKSGPVVFVMEMKLASLMSVWRNERSWQIVSPDKELADVVTANLRDILPQTMLNILRSSLAYGASFNELVWDMKSPYELGLSKSRASSKLFAVAKVPNSCNPTSIDRIMRTQDGSFDGFVQIPKHFMTTRNEILVSVDQALVVPYKYQYRNLWGESYLKPMYPIWFWYEVALRSWVRYLERMATPVTVAYAPSRAKIRKPGSTTLTDAMTWGLAIAGNVAKSNAAVLPSDVDPTTNQPLWRLEYLTAEDRGAIFKDALEFLARMLVQAGMSADMTFTQPSGGTGSYNIWEGHNTVTQLHNELILIEHLAALNKWWLPWFSRYTRGMHGPPIWLETVGLDPQEQEHLFKLAGVSGNSAGFQDALLMIDWRKLYSDNRVPVLTEKQLQEKKKELQDEALERQRAFVEVQKDAAAAQQNKQDRDGNRPPGPSGTPPATVAKEAEEDAKKLERMGWLMVDGQYSPILLTNDEMESLMALRSAGGDVVLRTGGDEHPFNESEVQLFNPWHDKLGLFTSGRGRGAAGAAESGAGLKGKKKGSGVTGAKPGSFLKTTGKILGIAGLGAVAFMVLGTVAARAGGTEGEEAIAEDEAKQEPEIPRFENEQEAVRYVSDELGKLGVIVSPDVSVEVVDLPAQKIPGDGEKPPSAVYDPDGNVVRLQPDLAVALLSGDPNAYWALVHEVAHSAQEQDASQGMLAIQAGTIGFARTAENFDRYGQWVEGNNEAITVMSLAATFGADFVLRQGDISDYAQDLEAWSAMAKLSETRTGQRKQEFLVKSHDTAMIPSSSWDILYELFPERMGEHKGGLLGGKTYPDPKTVIGWLAEEGIDTDQSLKEMLEEAERLK